MKRHRSSSAVGNDNEHSDDEGDRRPQHHHRRRGKTARLPLIPLLCPTLTLLGLYRFSTSFFLAKRSVPRSSPCTDGAATDLLETALGLSKDETRKLIESGVLARPRRREYGGSKATEKAETISDGCWMDRRVDAAVIIVVDALRFDFARDRLPLSVGSRLGRSTGSDGRNGDWGQGEMAAKKAAADGKKRSQLFKFVADPPTVTMQRLKGLTTGGLPTFADISGSFGGADVDEDSWVQQLRDVPPFRRGFYDEDDRDGGRRPKLGFVGDDTWIDLFPTQFNDCHPYPSFNTRDLDTVDDGCLLHLPRLLKSLGAGTGNATVAGSRKKNGNDDSFEVVVAHFLGVDHVGHTYGPRDPHMGAKLGQMDVMLASVLDAIDNAPSDACYASFIFGDHGMTEDGNHGGGTDFETNAALFVHFSPGCGDFGALDVTGSEVGSHSEEAFKTMHQIDLVPTISLMLGLPIPFANLGGLVPALLPPLATKTTKRGNGKDSNGGDHSKIQAEAPLTAAALALNAAQVWNYLTTYSRAGNPFPAQPLADLKGMLRQATTVYQTALSHNDGHDALAYREACGLFKIFLSEATDLGKRVWTRFDTVGMGAGIAMLVLSLLLGVPSWSWLAALSVRGSVGVTINTAASFKGGQSMLSRRIEVGVTGLFMVFHCIVLTFSNSYIEHEHAIVMYALSVLCMLLSLRLLRTATRTSLRRRGEAESNSGKLGADGRALGIFPPSCRAVALPLLVAACSRTNDLFVSGHGLDPSIRLHGAHHSAIFLCSLFALCILRSRLARPGLINIFAVANYLLDLVALVCLAFSWWEKRVRDHSRNGYLTSRAAMIFSAIGAVASLVGSWLHPNVEHQISSAASTKAKIEFQRTLALLFRVTVFIVAVTGPSAASSAVLFLVQAWALHQITGSRGTQEVHNSVTAAVWRLSVRHAFFATGHACSFNRLHYSAAFVATETFYFYSAGVSLFLNTFGWEIVGTILVLSSAKMNRKGGVWNWFCFYQLLETVSACISVSVMRRHLMVWAIFAPRFVFATAFTTVGIAVWLAESIFCSGSSPTGKEDASV